MNPGSFNARPGGGIGENTGDGTHANTEAGANLGHSNADSGGTELRSFGSATNPASDMNPGGGTKVNSVNRNPAGGPNVVVDGGSIAGGSAKASGLLPNPSSPSPQALPQAVITISDKVITATADMENKRIYIGSQILSVGDGPLTIAGQKMILSSNALVIGSDVTLPLPSPTKPANAQTTLNPAYNSVGGTASGMTSRPGSPILTTKPSLARLVGTPVDSLKLLFVALGVQWLAFKV
jgi:hypothetical protein